MNGVIGMNALLMRTELNREQRTFAKSVQLSAANLLVIINDILDVSKLEAGKVELEATSFRLEDLVEDAIELMSPRADEKGLEVVCRLDSGTRTALVGDPVRLRQVVLNLLSNALKFTDRGFVSVEIVTRPVDDGAVTLRCEVADTGIGLDAEAKTRLFQKFQQADSSITRRFGGTGLGLSICQQLVTLMHGRIGVADRNGGGSVFWFEVTLPRGVDAPPVSRPPNLAGVKALVADDLDASRRVLRETLEDEGMQVDEAVDGADCLARIAAAQAADAPYDIILLDEIMPDLAGHEVAARIRAGAGRSQPCLVLMAPVALALSPDDADRAALDRTLPKPGRRRVLVEALGELVSGEAALADSAESPPQEATIQAQGHVLLAEDNQVNRLIAVTVLESMGCRVDCAVNGAEAVAAVEARDYDLILMDVHMPEMDGLEATRLIRSMGGDKAAVPILAMTADAASSDKDRCLAAGMDDFISKPIDIQRLAEVAAHWILRGPGRIDTKAEMARAGA